MVLESAPLMGCLQKTFIITKFRGFIAHSLFLDGLYIGSGNFYLHYTSVGTSAVLFAENIFIISKLLMFYNPAFVLSY